MSSGLDDSMEGLAAFVSKFGKGRPESSQIGSPSARSRQANSMPSSARGSPALPFSIAEILSDKGNEKPSNELDEASRKRGIEGKKRVRCSN